MSLVFMTCQVMYGNGARIGTKMPRLILDLHGLNEVVVGWVRNIAVNRLIAIVLRPVEKAPIKALEFVGISNKCASTFIFYGEQSIRVLGCTSNHLRHLYRGNYTKKWIASYP